MDAYTTKIVSQNNFPPLLKEINDPPGTLYYKGKLPNFDAHKLLSVVGSRRFTSYGKSVCEHLIEGLSGFPVIIVSGLALGIDAIAHRTALGAGLITIAIPGSGLDESVLYPRTNIRLAEDILSKGGALISEFEPKQRATPYLFPQRNRIMAGMSHATLIIEANERSGTLITARLALEYNREVFVVPGDIFREAGRGSNNLLRLGATPVTSSSDILDFFDIITDRSLSKQHENLSKEENQVLAILEEPKTKDEIVYMLSVPIHETHALLSTMEIKGLIIERMGKFYGT